MTWDTAWAGERASEALAYLAQHYPEASASPELHPHQDAAHDAAAAEDEGRYLEALRGYMRAGRDEVLRIRKEAA
ncbi:MAG: hypothetical protein AVDCRST_MAG01-01-957 [uncultured Rubrobacteraceae bacterium]|uniref:Uncharacterized protein n=1 Tax=uncultured Rubrobacteraceae bacterium TaxID=349277 RepID=A0A6J4NWV9_9ACTN|nr:MAG: hypothetical protein AVDCRST_MAG01-01-957 [uncultured Rubrobacteraceae bacterium]